MSSSNSFLGSLADLLSRLFGSAPRAKPPPTPTPPPQPSPQPKPDDGVLKPQTPRVMLVVYNPVVDAASGKKLIETLNWNDPDQLAAGYIADIAECSGGLVAYQIVDRVEVDELPIKADGFRYSAAQYVNVARTNIGAHDPDAVDYGAIMSKFNVLARVAANELDEVWLFGGPYFGFWEAAMGGAGAFFCNGGPLDNTASCPRKFVVMGFSYERGIGEMLEDLGHRAETTLAHLFGSDQFWNWAYTRPKERNPKTITPPLNLLERFLCFDQIAPGQANVGTLHYAPPSQIDYEWGNPNAVQSCADDWLQFPNLPEPPNYRAVTRADWGGGEIRAHHKWWLTHLPKVAGVTNGVANNWWRYVLDPNEVK